MTEALVCAAVDCEVLVDPKVHNQKYCSDECCREDTNRKLRERYHERQAIKSGIERPCISCGTTLSRYNMDNICAACKLAQSSSGEVVLSILSRLV